MVTQNHYDNDTLAELLRNRRATGRHVLDHVESCEMCQARLELLSKGEMTWEDVAQLLAPSDDANHWQADDLDVAQPERDSPSSRLGFLEPSEYPNSLGRFARYEVMEILGRGGMGVVIRGYDTSLGRHSAVKILAPELASNAAARKRFSREARIAAAVVHPHVIPIHTVDQHNGLPYLVMPVVEGASVEARVAQSGPLQVIEAVRIAAQIADGLAAAHEQGLVHRDIKPANILLENGVERVQITDFGLARAIDDASMTRSGVISGTPQYMSPEQAHGDAIDHRSDLFSLGGLIYFMLTGHSPFRAETTMGVLNRIGNDSPRSLRSINSETPEWLERIVAKLLEKRPADRFQTAAEVAERFERWLAHLQQPTLVAPPEPPSTPSDSAGSWRRNWLFAAGVVGCLAIATLLSMTQSNSGAADGEAAERTDVAKPLTGLRADQRVLWRAPLGTLTMRAPVVHDDHIYVSTNNGRGYLKRFPASVDLGVLLCFRKSDGQFLWQHSNEKLASGRVHDWPSAGVTSRPCAEGERLWYVTNRAEIVCLDTEGFRDGENDGPIQDESHTDLNEADVVWRLDLMKTLGVQPHNISTCTLALWKDRLFAVTGNGVGESHRPPLADAPSFIAVDKTTGELLWQDGSPGQNVLHGQWGSPTVVDTPGKPQVIFPGGDGWLYSFDPMGAENGRSKLLWKFDCNPKDSIWKLGGRGDRNNLIQGPTVHGEFCYVATGQDPEHGGGAGRVWCMRIDGSGDVSAQLVYNQRNPDRPIDHRRRQACVADDGDFTRPNPNSKAVWQFAQQDVDGNGSIEIQEKMSRSISAVAIDGDLLFVPDTEGILHCLDRRTGKQHWSFDTYTNVFSTPVIVGERVYLGTEDGEILVFTSSAEFHIAAPNGEPRQRIQCDSNVSASVVADGKVLYFTTKNELIAVSNQPEAKSRQ